jgi:hypothetical protein
MSLSLRYAYTYASPPEPSRRRRSALEDALRRLQEIATALDMKADTAALKDASSRLERLISGGAAAPSTPDAHAEKPSSGRKQLQPQQQQDPQWIVSHELGGDAAAPAIEQLRAQVADLAARVSEVASALPSVAGKPARLSSMGVDGLDPSSIQAALASLHGQLGELGTRLAGKADTGEVARLELALNSRADVDELAEIRLALGSKADAAALGDLQVTPAMCADLRWRGFAAGIRRYGMRQLCPVRVPGAVTRLHHSAGRSCPDPQSLQGVS